MSDRPAYPRRPSHFAHRFVRVLHKSCAAQDIGQAACYMLCIIAHTEDAGRYAGPARFWNSQLMETLGFKSPKQLDIARDKAVAAGWLAYNRGGTRSVGEYFVLIPERFTDLTDTPLETIRSASGMSDGMNSGTNPGGLDEGFIPQFVPILTHEGNGKRNAKGTESGKPPIPIPNPIPKREGARFTAPTFEEVTAYCRERNNHVDAQQFVDYYTANGWKVGRNPMKDWRAAVRTWEKNGVGRGGNGSLANGAGSMYADLTPPEKPLSPAEPHRRNGKAHSK